MTDAHGDDKTCLFLSGESLHPRRPASRPLPAKRLLWAPRQARPHDWPRADNGKDNPRLSSTARQNELFFSTRFAPLEQQAE